MTQVVNKIVAPDEGKEYPFKVDAENVEMPNGMSLAQFYKYVMDFFEKADFLMYSDEAPQSPNVKLWYQTGELEKDENLEP